MTKLAELHDRYGKHNANGPEYRFPWHNKYRGGTMILHNCSCGYRYFVTSPGLVCDEVTFFSNKNSGTALPLFTAAYVLGALPAEEAKRLSEWIQRTDNVYWLQVVAARPNIADLKQQFNLPDKVEAYEQETIPAA